MDLVNELISDHWDIRELMKQLRADTITAARRRNLLKQFLPLVEAHSEGESKILSPYAKKKRGLRAFAVGDDEEHKTIDFLLRKLKRAATPELEAARTHLLCELLEHHLDEEEVEYFPELRGVLAGDDSERLALRYRFLTETRHLAHPTRSKPSFLNWLAGRPQRNAPIATDTSIL